MSQNNRTMTLKLWEKITFNQQNLFYNKLSTTNESGIKWGSHIQRFMINSHIHDYVRKYEDV